MVHDQFKFLLLDPCTTLRKYLEYEISFHGTANCLTWDSKENLSQSDLPLLSGATNFQVILNLLPLIGDNQLFFNNSSLVNSGAALKHGLIGTERLLVHLTPFFSSSSPLAYANGLFPVESNDELLLNNPLGQEITQRTKQQEPVNILCFCLTDLLDPKGTNTITAFLEECLKTRKPKIPFQESFYPLNCRNAAKLLLRATMMCYWEPTLSGFYDLGPNGTPAFDEVLDFALQSAKKLRPDLTWAKNFDFKNSFDLPPHRQPDLLAFQDSFEIVLPDWKDCVLETVSGYVANLS